MAQVGGKSAESSAGKSVTSAAAGGATAAAASAKSATGAGHLETAILAGGCFWGMEDILRKIPGVVETEAVYTGGKTSTPDV